MMSRVREFLEEWRARRAGRRHISHEGARAARDITGAIGLATSRAWDHAEKGSQAYIQSFDEGRLPPSLHISARDQIRAGKAMPLAERCIEDAANPDAEQPGPWSMEELEKP